MSFKSFAFNHLKNIPGWKTKKKIIIFSVDDYGNVRLDSPKAKIDLQRDGIRLESMFDIHDTLESREDLLALYDVLSRYKDVNSKPSVFTPYALSCNLDFERIQENGFSELFIETLPETYNKLASRHPKVYENTWSIWREGIDAGYLRPEYHSREHFNFKTINDRLHSGDKELISILKTRSLTGLTQRPNETPYSVALGFQNFNENEQISQIVSDGIEKFDTVFGLKPSCFMPPSASMSPIHHKLVLSKGIKGIDSFKFKKYQYDTNNVKSELRWTGKKVTNDLGRFIVRNCVFEPLQQKNSFNICKQMVQAAFTMNSPAIISSHRVNYVGFANERFRKDSLIELSKLLNWVVKRYPDVHFYSMTDLINEISQNDDSDL
jgi:hypothetical protein